MAGGQSATYHRLATDAERAPKKITDHRDAWDRLPLIAAVNGTVQERILAFTNAKGISLDALTALGTRIKLDKGGGVELAWASEARSGAITGVKFRPLGDKKRYALNLSTWLEPLVIGNVRSLDWIVAEGETDAARLYDLIGDKAAILVLPAGALTFKPGWGDVIPRGATVGLCHDADEAGDKGAEKAMRIIAGRTVRIRPPIEGGDWCDWAGSREDFLDLVAAERQGGCEYEFSSLADFLSYPFPAAEPLLGEPGAIYLATGSFLLVYGAEGTGKSTWTIDAIAHLGAGVDWLGLPVPRPVRFCVIENEGPAALFQQKIANKAKDWDSAPFRENVFVFASPWGEFSFANPEARQALSAFCDEHNIDVVVANPTLGLGVAASGRPDETQQFVDWLKECGLTTTRAFWLLHHENKSGQISGDWGRHPDTKVQLQGDGNRPRTKLIWEKTRWATLPADGRPKSCMLEWVVETQGYNVVELEATGASDGELEERLDAYLAEHPLSSTRSILKAVKGTNDRLSELLKSNPKYDSVKGDRGANLYLLASDTPGGVDTDTSGNVIPLRPTVPRGEPEGSER